MKICLYNVDSSDIEDFPISLNAVDGEEAQAFSRERSDSFIVTELKRASVKGRASAAQGIDDGNKTDFGRGAELQTRARVRPGGAGKAPG
jgi:hypothetical protein